MNRFLLACILAGAATTASLVAVSLVTAALWRSRAAALAAVAPPRRAQLLAILRLTPAGVAVSAATVTFTAFLRFEPTDVRETAGVLLVAASIAGASFVLAGLLRLAHALWHTARTVRAWGGVPIGTERHLPIVAVDTSFPVVAVVGLVRPRLLLARQVVAVCDRSELEAMVAHESAHIVARDNLTRLLFAAAPMVPFTSRSSHAIEQAWISASEEAADDVARGNGRSPMALASAITKVARLARGRPPLVHASAILSGHGIEQRVRRLFDRPPRDEHRHHAVSYLLTTVLAATVLLSPPIAASIYEVAEFCVRNLP